MSNILSKVSNGIRPVPIFALLHGLDGVGKTTFAANAPSPLFIGVESGSMQLDVSRLPVPDTYAEFVQQVTAVQTEPHQYKTLAIDTLDWLEPLIWQQVCAEGNVNSIELFQGGYGKGYTRALDHWRTLVRLLSQVNRRMHVVLIAHSMIRKFEDPEQAASYDRYQVALHDKAAQLVRQAVDAVLFANFKVKVINIKKDSGKGKGGSERVMYTENRAAFDAKNRFALPFEMPLDWKTFGAHIKSFYAQSPADEEPSKPEIPPVVVTPAAEESAKPAEPPAEEVKEETK